MFQRGEDIELLDSTIIRQVDGQLLWYPPGVDTPPIPVDSEDAREHLAATPRAKLCFAVPGTDLTLVRVKFDAAEKKHIGKSLPFTLEEQLASDIDELHIASTLVDESSLCAAVCSKQKMQTWQQALQAYSGINEWIPEPQLLPWHAGEWTLLGPVNVKVLALSGNCCARCCKPPCSMRWSSLR